MPSESCQLEAAIRAMVLLFREGLGVDVEVMGQEDLLQLTNAPQGVIVFNDVDIDQDRSSRDVERCVNKQLQTFTLSQPPLYGDVMFRLELYARQHINKDDGTVGLFALFHKATQTFIANQALVFSVDGEEVVKPLDLIPSTPRFTTKPSFSNIRSMELLGAIRQVKLPGKAFFEGSLFKEFEPDVQDFRPQGP